MRAAVEPRRAAPPATDRDYDYEHEHEQEQEQEQEHEHEHEQPDPRDLVSWVKKMVS